RLDKDTSGCLVVAKTEPVLRSLQAAFKARDVEKRYRALVHGSPPDRAELDTFHGRHPDDRKRFSSRVRGGKRAITRFSLLARAEGAALLDVELLTGRTHQIRAHLADRGWPLFCDALYGATRREGPAAPPAIRRAAAALGRQGLHAARLAFTHPVTGAHVACEAPLPADLRATLSMVSLPRQPRILDVGSGPAPAAIAAIDLLGGEATCFDASEPALAEARALGIERTTRELPREGFDLTLAANVLSELPDPLALVRGLQGTVAIVEPALRETGRALLSLRDALLREGWFAVAPCFTQAPCPALASPKDWCTAEVRWTPPPYFVQLADATGLRADEMLSFAPLALSRTPPAP